MNRSLRRASHQRREVGLLITDLDDTIWRWFSVWHASFTAMLDEVERVTGIPRSRLLPEIKKVHQRHHTSEYTWVLDELPCLQRHFGNNFDAEFELDSAIHAYRSARKRTFRLYPTVMTTLKKLKQRGVRIVAFTESQQFQTTRRMVVGELDGVIDVVYATSESHQVGKEEHLKARAHGRQGYILKQTTLRVLPHGLKKPNPEVLADILAEENCPAERAIYVGDTVSKDIRMAGLAGVLAAHAKYGENHDREGYELLKAVTHWTPKEVAEQRRLAKLPSHPPEFTLKRFSDLLGCVKFVRF